MSRLAITLLGPPRVELDDEPLHIGRRKVLALLAYLAVTNKRHSRETLAAFLAPDFGNAYARTDLRRTLSLLNRLLGDGWLDTDRETIGLQSGAAPSASSGQTIWLDVHHFRQRLAGCQTHGHPLAKACPQCVQLLKDAADLYQGDFMAGFSLPGSLPFDEWQRFESEALHQEMASALERLVQGLSAQDDDEAAIPHARRWLELNLTHEPAHRALMELYARTGQTSAALHQYEYCIEMLADELGVPPSAETRALHEQIRAGQVTETRRVPSDRARVQDGVQIQHNLPPQPTPFFGREAELAELDRLITDPNVRLITILGPGGIGKTRLALAVSERKFTHSTNLPDSRFPHGACFVPLVGLSAPDQIVPSMVDALGLQQAGGQGDSRPPRQQVLDYLREKRLLLIMDNYEHLLEGVDLVTDIIHTAPEVQVLVTSRERLQLREEHAYTIYGLAFPDLEGPGSEPPTDWSKFAAVQLFLGTAHQVRTDFQVADDKVDHLMHICRSLEDMPLGIELAAGWIDVLSVADIAAEIQRSLDFLETEWRDAPDRHRSMRAVFDASWQRLSAAEQETFVQLCVFRGGFTRAAAKTVAGADLRILARLANKSLLRFVIDMERYTLHELLRQYGAEILASDPPREAAARDRHSAYYCAALGRWYDDLNRRGEVEEVFDIKDDWTNVRAAWEEAAHKGHTALLDQAMDGLRHLIYVSSRFREGEGMYGLACDRLMGSATQLSPDEQRVLARALIYQSMQNAILGFSEITRAQIQTAQSLLEDRALSRLDTRSEWSRLHRVIGWEAHPDDETSRWHYERAMQLHRELAEEGEAAFRLLEIAEANGFLGDFEKERQNLEEGLALFRAVGNHMGVVRALVQLSRLAKNRGDYEEAITRCEDAVSQAQAKGYPSDTASAQEWLGWLILNQGDFQTGATYLHDSVDRWRAQGWQQPLAICLARLSAAYWFRGYPEQAYVYSEESLAIAAEAGIPYDLGFSTAYRARLDAAAGRYDTARTVAQKCLTIAQTKPNRFLLALSKGALGWIALAEGKYATAEPLLKASITTFQEAGSRDFVAWSTAGWCGAARGLGWRKDARAHLFDALDTVVEIRAYVRLLDVMPVVPLLLADEEHARAAPLMKERAVELYALAKSQPYIAKSQLFEDVAGKHIKAATASLPPDVIEAAQERGGALDWWETAEQLLDELRDLGWASPHSTSSAAPLASG